MASIAQGNAAATPGKPDVEIPDHFDPGLLQKTGLTARLTAWFVRNPLWLMAFLRRYWPIPRLGNWAIVTRYDDVAEALQNDRDVEVPFGPMITTLNDGPNFVLGMADGPDYRDIRAKTMKVFPLSDNDTRVGPIAYRQAEKLVEDGKGRLDGIRDLITLVPTRICQEYYGLKIPADQEYDFARWTIAMSAYMFGNPTDDPDLKKAAIPASRLVREIVDASIDAAKTGPRQDTIVSRLVTASGGSGPPVTDEEARAILVGMVTGFVPTNTMAAGHMLVLLLENPQWLRRTREAALSDDDDLLKRCLFETMRFWPLNPGPFRVAGPDGVTLAAGTRREKTIKPGAQILVSTQSAMFDPRRIEDPMNWNPDRKQADYMLMGFGLHWCIGAPLAYSQITQTFKPLLLKKNLRKARGKDGRLKTFGPFPESLIVEYDT